LAINGRGFFRMSNGGEITYTRNGQFQLDKDGYLVNAQGGRLTGYPADANGRVMAGVPTELRLQTGDVAPKLTSSGAVTANLDARAAVPAVPFDLNDGSSYNGATSIAVYDSQGTEHTVALYFRKANANEWEVHAYADGNVAGTVNLTFDANGRLDAASATSLTVAVPDSTGGGGTFDVDFDLGRISQFGSAFAVSELSQDGYAAGRLAGFSIASDGTVISRYTNGQTLAQGRVVLVHFT